MKTECSAQVSETSPQVRGASPSPHLLLIGSDQRKRAVAFHRSTDHISCAIVSVHSLRGSVRQPWPTQCLLVIGSL